MKTSHPFSHHLIEAVTCSRLLWAFEHFQAEGKRSGDDIAFDEVELRRIGKRDSWDFRAEFIVFCKTGPDDVFCFTEDFSGLREESTSSSGMQLDLAPCTSSARSMLQARQWIDKCSQDHVTCKPTEACMGMPTRLVHVERNSASRISAKLTLHDAHSTVEPYLSLSHRWSKKQHATLTSLTFDAFGHNIPIEELSRVVQDAIYVTAALGYRYIWIDSLCITQDDRDDWQRESARMHQVYRGAVCNLSATEFDSGDDGLAINERLMNPVPPTVCPVWSAIPVEASELGTEQNIEGHIETFPQKQRFVLADGFPTQRPMYSGPLFRRAWVLQEQMLAVRTLHFSREQLYWECCEQLANEIWPSGFRSSSDAVASYESSSFEEYRVWRVNFSKLAEKQAYEVHHIWRHLLREYMHRQITFSCDRLPALRGISSKFASVLSDDQCRFGLWMNDPFSLLWTQIAPGHGLRARKTADIPTWSWAAWDEEVFWRCDLRQARYWATGHLFANTLSSANNPDTPELKIEGPLVLLHPQRMNMLELHNGLTPNFGLIPRHRAHTATPRLFVVMDGQVWSMFDPDDDEEPVNKPLYFLPIAKARSDEHSYKQDHPVVYLAAGLILERQSSLGKGVYTRIGTGDFCSPADNFDKLFPLHQKELSRDDYTAIDDRGMCTITII